MHIVARTDVGLVRRRNEDFFVIDPGHDLIVLCDGMGGHPGGDLASRMAAEEVGRAVAGDGENEIPLGNLAEIAALAPFGNLVRGVFAADRKLRAYGRKHAEFAGMGTTLAALQEDAGLVCAVHVGDSRVYCYRAGNLAQLTQDHSYIATLPESARATFAGIRNILTRAVGVGEELEVDFTVAPAHPDEIYLLCTDGLHNFVGEDRIAAVLSTVPDREACLATLIDDANRGGGGDNITLALAWIDKPPATEVPRQSGAVVEGPHGLRAQVLP